MATITAPQPLSAEPYCIPGLLQDIRLLDLLELSGSTVQASRFLSLSQPTVSRRYRLLAQDFGLQQAPRQLKRCCYGSTEAMRWLRLGCRAHRLAAGVARIGADWMHQPLLEGVDGLLPVPTRFRSIHAWATLVREGVLDAALVSGLEIQAAGPQLDWSGLQWMELGALPLCLVSAANNWSSDGSGIKSLPVLTPMRGIAPGLHRSLRSQGLSIRTAGSSCMRQEDWLERLWNHPVSMAAYKYPQRNENQRGKLRSISLREQRVFPIGLLAPIGEVPDAIRDASDKVIRIRLVNRDSAEA
jgi:hypothetical protein